MNFLLPVLFFYIIFLSFSSGDGRFVYTPAYTFSRILSQRLPFSALLTYINIHACLKAYIPRLVRSIHSIKLHCVVLFIFHSTRIHRSYLFFLGTFPKQRRIIVTASWIEEGDSRRPKSLSEMRQEPPLSTGKNWRWGTTRTYMVKKGRNRQVISPLTGYHPAASRVFPNEFNPSQER